MDFIRLHKNFDSAAKGFDDIVVKAIAEKEAELIDLNTSQLEQGIGSDGNGIQPEYFHEEYAKFKKSIGSGAPIGTPDLKLTGDFYSGFMIENIQPDYIEITSKDPKANDLEGKYGSMIYGLTDNNKGMFAQDHLRETLTEMLYNEITK